MSHVSCPHDVTPRLLPHLLDGPLRPPPPDFQERRPTLALSEEAVLPVGKGALLDRLRDFCGCRGRGRLAFREALSNRLRDDFVVVGDQPAAE